MKIDIGATMHNKYEFKLVDSRTGKVKYECTAYNLVTNSYYDTLRSNTRFQMNYIHLGSGTNTPTVTDTSLGHAFYSKTFSWWTDYGNSWGGYSNQFQYLGPNQYAISKTITFTENEGNGNITEVGLSNTTYDYIQYGSLYTHALITDSEGNPITIVKTDTDRLLLTITLYITLTVPNLVLPFKGCKICPSMYADQNFTDNWMSVDACPDVIRWVGGLGPDARNAGDALYYVYFSTSPGGLAGATYTPNSHSYDELYSYFDTSTISGGIRLTMHNRILAAEKNLPINYQIYDIITGFGNIPITSDIFPPINLTITRNADGNTTDFNFGVAELMNEVSVYIDDVLQPANSYTWNRFDKTLYQAWETSRGDYLKKCCGLRVAGNGGRNRTSLIFNSAQYYRIDSNPTSQVMLYDFGEIKNINRAYRYFNYSSDYTKWEYSIDGSNWTTLTIPASSDRTYDFPTPIAVRYLKHPILNSGLPDTCWDEGYKPPATQDIPPALCEYKPQLKFNTAPPAGSVVKIEAKSAYPIKNSNWIIDQLVIDISISRGNS